MKPQMWTVVKFVVVSVLMRFAASFESVLKHPRLERTILVGLDATSTRSFNDARMRQTEGFTRRVGIVSMSLASSYSIGYVPNMKKSHRK